MKKLMSLVLILALTVPALSGCRRKAAETPEATATPQPGGLPYTITDADDAPSVPDPLATLTPQERAAITVGSNGGDVTEDMLPPGGDQPTPTADPQQAADDYELATYDEAADKYTLDDGQHMSDQFYEVYGRFSEWLTRYQL